MADVNSPPPGGFQQGGWYWDPSAKQARQYFNGGFGDPGKGNNPQQSDIFGKQAPTFPSTSPGATTVPGATASGNTTASGGLSSYLSNYQQGAKVALDNLSTQANQSDEQILAQVKSALTPSTPAPTPPNMVQTYTGFLASSGVTQMQTQLGTLNSQIAAINSKVEAQAAAEEAKGGTVPLNVIAGRQTEEQRQAQVQLDSLNLQKGVLVDQINMQMNNINTYMQLTQQDYQNASQAYQQEFDMNSKIYDAFTTATSKRDQLSLELQKAASANFQTMANLITSGNINVSQMSPEQKLQITQMETQAGLPAGTFENLQMSPKDRLLNVSQYRGQVTAIMSTPDGQITTQTFGSMQPLSGASGQKEVEMSLQPQFGTALQKVASSGNNQGHVDPANWNAALDDWINQGGSEKSFIDNFKQYTDPNRKDFESAYGISLAQRGITPSAESASNYYASP